MSYVDKISRLTATHFVPLEVGVNNTKHISAFTIISEEATLGTIILEDGTVLDLSSYPLQVGFLIPLPMVSIEVISGVVRGFLR